MWSKKLRNNTIVVFIVCMFVNVGMWLERFVIIVVSLHRDFVPSSWEMYRPTIWDFATLFGSIGLFVFLFFIFIRLLPMITIFEMHGLVAGAKPTPRPVGAGDGSH
jgi:molybdopterin-containing oxidoreductase family membrane subunit